MSFYFFESYTIFLKEFHRPLLDKNFLLILVNFCVKAKLSIQSLLNWMRFKYHYGIFPPQIILVYNTMRMKAKVFNYA